MLMRAVVYYYKTISDQFSHNLHKYFYEYLYKAFFTNIYPCIEEYSVYGSCSISFFYKINFQKLFLILLISINPSLKRLTFVFYIEQIQPSSETLFLYLVDFKFLSLYLFPYNYFHDIKFTV